MVWYGMVWYGMVWYGMVWYGMVWYGMVWYGMCSCIGPLLDLLSKERAAGRPLADLSLCQNPVSILLVNAEINNTFYKLQFFAF
jgi:hypothetical protein